MARILVLGAGVFGRLAAAEARTRGHEAVHAHRSSSTLRADATDAASTLEAIARSRAEAVLHAAGPFRDRPPAVAHAAHEAGIPYVDLSDEEPFSKRVARIPAGVPLLTGMSTAPAVVGALAQKALARSPGGRSVRVGVYVGAGNRQGPATLAFAAHARRPGRGERVDFPGVGPRRAYPARVHVDLQVPSPTLRGAVAVGGVPGIGWRFPALVRAAPGVGHRIPRFSRDTRGSLVAEVLDEGGARLGREGLFAEARGQRVAVLPAIWALEEALAHRAPPRPVSPGKWVDPEALLDFLESSGFQRVSE